MESVGVPQKNRYHCYTVEEHTIRTVAETPAVRVVRWAALLHDIAKPRCRVTDAAGIDHFTGIRKWSGDGRRYSAPTEI